MSWIWFQQELCSLGIYCFLIKTTVKTLRSLQRMNNWLGKLNDLTGLGFSSSISGETHLCSQQINGTISAAINFMWHGIFCNPQIFLFMYNLNVFCLRLVFTWVKRLYIMSNIHYYSRKLLPALFLYTQNNVQEWCFLSFWFEKCTSVIQWYIRGQI